MTTGWYHNRVPHHTTANGKPTVSDPGLLGLEHEIRATPTDQLAEMATLLIELPPAMQAMAWPRLTVWELREHVTEGSVAA